MKKKIIIILLLILLASLVSCASRTGQRVAPFDPGAAGGGFRAGLSSIESFFSGGWQNYEKTTAFLIFFFLFYSAFLIGGKKAFAGELTRAHKVFAFVAALLSASLIATTMRFDWVNLEYVAWFLIGVLTIFLIHTLLLKLGLENKKFLAFILALLIATLLLWLIWYFMSEGRALERVGRVSNWFSGLDGKVDAKGVTPVTKEEPIIAIRREEEGRSWLRYWWVLAVILALLYGGNKGRNWLRRRREERAGEGGAPPEVGPPGEGPEDPFEGLIRKLNIISERKKNIQRSVEKFENEKNELVKDLDVIKKEIKKARGIKRFLDEKLPSLRDRGSDQFEELNEEYKSIKGLFVINLKIKHQFKALLLIENYITSAIRIIRDYVGRLGIGQDMLQRINLVLEDLRRFSINIHNELQIYFELDKEEELTEERIRHLLSKNNIEDRIRKEWLNKEIKTEKHLKVLIDREFEEYKKINNLIEQEKDRLDNIIKILKEEKEKRP